MTIERPMFPPRAESVDSFSPQPSIGQPESEGLSRRAALAGLAILPAGAAAGIAGASAVGTDAELIALGKKLEVLVDAYYAARQPWARALSEAHRIHDETFDPADRDYRDTPEIAAAWGQTCQRLGTAKANDRMSAVHREIEPIADAITAMPCTSIEGLRAKALVAFWEVAPLFAGATEFHFGDAWPFQQLFAAVAELCGLNSKIAATGFDMPPMWSVDHADDEEEA